MDIYKCPVCGNTENNWMNDTVYCNDNKEVTAEMSCGSQNCEEYYIATFKLVSVKGEKDE